MMRKYSVVFSLGCMLSATAFSNQIPKDSPTPRCYESADTMFLIAQARDSGISESELITKVSENSSMNLREQARALHLVHGLYETPELVGMSPKRIRDQAFAACTRQQTMPIAP